MSAHFTGWHDQNLAAANDAVCAILIALPAGPARDKLWAITDQIERADSELQASERQAS